MTFDGLEYDPEDCRIGVSSGHSIIHVTVWHPHWGSAQTAALRAGIFGGVARETVPDLDTAQQMLTAALGSEVVATRIGTIEVTDHCPDRGITMDELREMLHKMDPNTSILNGEPAWTSLRMFVDGEDVEVKAVSPLSPVISPGSDVHVLAVAQIDPVSAAHLTGAQIIDLTGELEDALTSTVADNAAGVLVAVVHASNSVNLHFYLNSALPGLDAVINTLRAVLSTWDVGEASLSRDEDPQWRAVSAFRV